jgi:hypothetical protein
MNRQKFLHGFQFQNDFILHEEIDLVATVQLQTFVFDRQDNLPLKAQSTKAELVAKALLVSRFQKAGAEVTMDLNRRAENRVRPRVPRFFFVSPGLDMNGMESAHPTISSQNCWRPEKIERLGKLASHFGTGGASTVGLKRPIY